MGLGGDMPIATVIGFLSIAPLTLDWLQSLPEEPAHSLEWMAYLEYIDDMVLQKLTQAVQSSVDVFFEETNPDRPLDENRPLFEAMFLFFFFSFF